MIHISDLNSGLKTYEALASPIRLQILQLLYENSKMNLDDIAKALNFTNGAITKHIKKLSDGKLIKVKLTSTSKGIEKICTLADEKLLVNLIPSDTYSKSYDIELDAGQFSSYNILPTCGLANSKRLIGELDDIKYFSYPDRFSANIVWFTSGYIEYRFPNPLKVDEQVKELQISLEVSSEAPGAIEHFPSDIHFSINDHLLCCYLSPGEFIDRKGLLTPNWWFENFGQYGRLKIITVDDRRTLLDGLHGSDISLKDLNLKYGEDISFKVFVPKFTAHVGGATIFGKGFGDYDQAIKLKLLV